MDFKVVLIVVFLLLDVINLHKITHKHPKKKLKQRLTNPDIIAEWLQKLREKQNPWETGISNDVDFRNARKTIKKLGKQKNVVEEPKWMRKLKERQNPWETGINNDASYFEKIIRGTSTTNQTFLWKSNEIPFEIHSDFTKDETQIIKNALYKFSIQTCIKPRPRRRSDTESILFVQKPGKGCFSWIGSHHVLQQQIYLEPSRGCVAEGSVNHELLYALGLFHEQSSPDRDEYVKIYWENIIEGAEDNFKMIKLPTTRFGLPYDYDSLMHYSGWAFSKNGRPTMKAKVSDVMLTRKYNLSELDIKTVNEMYNC